MAYRGDSDNNRVTYLFVQTSGVATLTNATLTRISASQQAGRQAGKVSSEAPGRQKKT